MPRFVILTHDFPFLHWDFMLERGKTLRTWRLLQSPDSAERIAAEPLPDHRRHYLDYEGPVSRGRGVVRCWDRGEYTVIEECDSQVVVRLTGSRLIGRAVVERHVDGDTWGVQFLPE